MVVSVFCPLCGSWMSVCQEEGTSGKCYVLALAFNVLQHEVCRYVKLYISSYFLLPLPVADDGWNENQKPEIASRPRGEMLCCFTFGHLWVSSSCDSVWGADSFKIFTRKVFVSNTFNVKETFLTMQCTVGWGGGLVVIELSLRTHTCNAPLFTPPVTRRARRKGPLMRRARPDGQ